MSPSPSSNAATAAAAIAVGVAGCASVVLLAQKFKSNRSGVSSREEAKLQQDDATRSCSPSSSSNDDERFKVPKELLEEDCRWREEVQLAVKLALEAGSNMIQHCDLKGTQHEQSESDLGISHKTNAADFATLVDVANEELIMNGIRTKFPTHDIIGEETVGTGAIPPLTDQPTWICDPIDGTTNFASGMPLTCVSIGFCSGKRPVMGVCYAPMTRELYVAVRGRGAYRNGVRIRSSSSSSSTKDEKRLSDAVVCFEFGYARSEGSIDRMLTGLKRVMLHGCRSTRSTGCGVLDLCYVATGRFDVVYTGLAEEGWKPWDYAASMVVAEEAGCTIRSLFGGPGDKGAADVFDEFDINGNVVEGSAFDIYSSSMICGVNRTIVEECRRVLLDLQEGGSRAYCTSWEGPRAILG